MTVRVAHSTLVPCIDHLIVLASDLPTGVAWCERALGVTPTAGGEHPLMGTHNRIFNISSAGHPRAYLEVIAIHSEARPSIPSTARRWFDMDDATLQRHVAQQGPQLIHWVASVPDLAGAREALSKLELERGDIVAANRPTPNGLLQWQITVRNDGQRLLDGCLPTLIQWDAVHPCDSLPASGVQLEQFALQHPQAPLLQAACGAIGVAGSVAITSGPLPRIAAQLSTPRGRVMLTSATGSE